MNILSLIDSEIRNYIDGTVNVRGVSFSTYETIKKIERFANCQYSTGNKDSLGNIKYWFDIISPAVNSEIKNIDFDTKDIQIESSGKNDGFRNFISNLKLKAWMRQEEIGVKINEDIEDSSGWGNIIWKVKKDSPYYEKLDLTNVYVINQLARTISGKTPDSPVIERHTMTQSELRAMSGVWGAEAVEHAIENYAEKGFTTAEGSGEQTNEEMPYYEVHERNGEVSIKDLKEAVKEEADEGDDKIYVLAKVVVMLNGGSNDDKGRVLFAKKIEEMPYYEEHRGRYEGRWLRKGIYEICFDIQIRANECGNEMARMLEFGGHQIFQTEDKLIYENLLSNLQRGDIIQTKGLNRVDVSAHDIGNYISEWNNLIALRDSLTNNFDVVNGDTPSGTPFKLGNLMNVNANKFYDFIREKMSLALESIFNKCILPSVFKNFKAEEAVVITGDSETMKRYFQMKVDSWYLANIWKFPPHNEEVAKTIKENAFNKLIKNKREVKKIEKDFWKDYEPRASIVIVGEGTNVVSDLNTMATFIQLESDPVRRQALIEMAMRRKGFDVDGLPKSQPAEMKPVNTNIINQLAPQNV